MFMIRLKIGKEVLSNIVQISLATRRASTFGGRGGFRGRGGGRGRGKNRSIHDFIQSLFF
jgi:hypothetical protein